MKKIIILIFFNLFTFATTQTPRFIKYDIAEMPLQIHLPTEPKWDKTIAEDISEIYTYHQLYGNITYTAIILKLPKTLKARDSESFLKTYVDYIENFAFHLDKKTGFKIGQTLDNQPKVKGILDTGKSKDEEYKLMGWTNGSYIVVLATSSLTEMNFNSQDLFLKGIRFLQKDQKKTHKKNYKPDSVF